MEFYIDTTENNVDSSTFTKMNFIYNALNDGWNVVKKDDKYIFKKKHEGDKELYLDTFLDKFIYKNIKVN